MLKYLSAFEIALWFANASAQLLLAAITCRRKLDSTYPGFALFVYFSALTTPICMILPARAYFWAYYVTSLMCLIIMAISAVEIYRKVFGPRISLPGWIPRSVAIWLCLSLVACAVPIVLLRPVNGSAYNVALSAAQSGLMAMLCVALWIVIGYARWMRFYWRPWTAGIAGGLVLCLTVNTVTFFLGGILRSAAAVDLAQNVGQISYLLCVGWWGWTLWEKEPAPEEITPELLEAVLTFHEETKEAHALVSGDTEEKQSFEVSVK